MMLDLSRKQDQQYFIDASADYLSGDLPKIFFTLPRKQQYAELQKIVWYGHEGQPGKALFQWIESSAQQRKKQEQKNDMIRSVKVEWDATEKQIKDNKLPNIVRIPNTIRSNSEIADYLSDEYGFTVLDWKKISPTGRTDAQLKKQLKNKMKKQKDELYPDGTKVKIARRKGTWYILGNTFDDDQGDQTNYYISKTPKPAGKSYIDHYDDMVHWNQIVEVLDFPTRLHDGQNKDGEFSFQTLAKAQIQQDHAFGEQTTERINFRLAYRKEMLEKEINKKARALYNTRTKTKTIDEIWKMISDLSENDRFETPLKSNLTFEYIPAILKHPNTSLELRNHLLDRILQSFKRTLLTKVGLAENFYHYENYRYLAPFEIHIWSESQFTRKMIDKILDFVLVDWPKFVDKISTKHADLFEMFFRQQADSKKADFRWSLYLNILPALIRNERMTGAQLKRIQPNKKGLHESWRKPVLVALAKNRKLPKGVRDALMQSSQEFIPRPRGEKFISKRIGTFMADCIPESKEAAKNAIRMALAQNPSLPKKDLLLLAQDPCISVAVVAQGMLKRRF